MGFGGIQPTSLAQIMGQGGTDSTSSTGAVGGAAASDSSSKTGEAGFGGKLMDAITELDETQQAADTAARDVAAGRTDDLAGSLLKIEEAEISLQLATTIRNKAVEAYQEIMRMNI